MPFHTCIECGETFHCGGDSHEACEPTICDECESPSQHSRRSGFANELFDFLATMVRVQAGQYDMAHEAHRTIDPVGEERKTK